MRFNDVGFQIVHIHNNLYNNCVYLIYCASTYDKYKFKLMLILNENII